MKFAILVEMLFELLTKRKLTAAYFSDKFKISPRTVHRYLEELSACLPVTVKRGREGGIMLSDCYKLPKNFLTEEEYDCVLNAIERAYAQTADEKFLELRRKLTAQYKTETFDTSRSSPTAVVGDLIICTTKRCACLKNVSKTAPFWKLRIKVNCARSNHIYFYYIKTLGIFSRFATPTAPFGCFPFRISVWL